MKLLLILVSLSMGTAAVVKTVELMNAATQIVEQASLR
jgi:hypothetical protein